MSKNQRKSKSATSATVKTRIFIVEGYCEETFIKALMNKNPNFLGKVEDPKKRKPVRPLNDNIMRLYRENYRKNSETIFYLIIDTDEFINQEHSQNRLKNLAHNVKFFKQYGFDNYLIFQVYDFEDELLHSCPEFLNNKDNLISCFSGIKNDKFDKNRFTKLFNLDKDNKKRLEMKIKKLDDNGFDITKLWKQKIPSILFAYEKYRKQGKDFQ